MRTALQEESRHPLAWTLYVLRGLVLGAAAFMVGEHFKGKPMFGAWLALGVVGVMVMAPILERLQWPLSEANRESSKCEQLTSLAHFCALELSICLMGFGAAELFVKQGLVFGQHLLVWVLITQLATLVNWSYAKEGLEPAIDQLFKDAEALYKQACEEEDAARKQELCGQASALHQRLNARYKSVLAGHDRRSMEGATERTRGASAELFAGFTRDFEEQSGTLNALRLQLDLDVLEDEPT